VEGDVYVPLAEGREDAQRDQPPTDASARAFARDFVAYDAAGCAKAFCGAGDEAGAEYKRGARHAELDLGAICDGVEEPDEVCFVSCEARVGGCGADLGDADGTAGEGCEDEAGGEVAVAGELDEGLGGFVGGHVEV